MICKTQLEKFKIHCKIHAKDLADDLFQHCILIVLEKGYKEKNFVPLLKRIAFYQLYNKRSSFSKAYKEKQIDQYSYKLMQEEDQEADQREQKLEVIRKAVKEQPKTKRELFIKEVYFEAQRLGSYSKLSKATGIPKVTLIKAGRRYENSIHNHF